MLSIYSIPNTLSLPLYFTGRGSSLYSVKEWDDTGPEWVRGPGRWLDQNLPPPMFIRTQDGPSLTGQWGGLASVGVRLVGEREAMDTACEHSQWVVGTVSKAFLRHKTRERDLRMDRIQKVSPAVNRSTIRKQPQHFCQSRRFLIKSLR